MLPRHNKSAIRTRRGLRIGNQSFRQSGCRASGSRERLKLTSATGAGHVGKRAVKRAIRARVARRSCVPLFMGARFCMDSIDLRMQSFVQWRGEVPPEACRIEDFDARRHAAPWLRLNIGRGIAGAYVIGFQCGEAWWSYFFERIERPAAPDGGERWRIEAYHSHGRSWIDDFVRWPLEDRWARAFPEP